jgi:hypothetical protein
MLRKSNEEQAHIIRLWHDNPFVWPKAIAAKAALENAPCCSSTAQKFYPFERWTDRIRLDQAIRALQIYPDCTAISIEHKTGISRSTVGKAKRVADLINNPPLGPSEPAPEPVAEPAPEPVAEPAPEPVAEPAPVAEPTPQVQRDNFNSVAFKALAELALVQPVLDKCEQANIKMALVLMWVRMCHLVHNPNHSDSVDDIQGYAETIRMIQDEQRQRE